jgi:hypothetical protein
VKCETNPISASRPAGGDYAKQSQSPAEMPTIPLFHHSTIPSGCLLRQTNPIARSGAPRRCRPWRPSGAPLFHYSIIPPFQSDAYRAKQSQFGLAGPGPRRAKDAKQTQFPATPDGTGSAGRGATRPRSPCGSQSCETNPISEPRPAGRRGQLYKQTQFPPLCRSGDRPSQGADCAKRTQFPPVPGGARPGGRGCRTNKANSR